MKQLKFDDFKKVEKEYKRLAQGSYERKRALKVYKLLPHEFRVAKPNKMDIVAGIKAYYEHIFLPALEKILGDDYVKQIITGQTSSQKSN